MNQSNLLKTLLLITVGIGAALPYPRRRQESTPQTGSEQPNFAFVGDDAAAMYKAPGTGMIAQLRPGTYAGVFTGKQASGYSEIATGIDDVTYRFWMASDALQEPVEGEHEAAEDLAEGAPQKSTAIVNQIVRAYA